MNGDNRIVRFLMFIVLAPAVGFGAYAPSQLPKPDHYVVDYANVIQPNREQELNSILQNLERTTGAQYIVLTIDSTGGIPIAKYCLEVANDNWKLGQQGKDNGMLFTIAVADREYRFTPGLGLEGFLTDEYLTRIGNDILVPYLKQGQYSEGIYAVNRHLVQRISEQLRATPAPAPARPSVSARPVTPTRPYRPARPYRPVATHSRGMDSALPCFVAAFFVGIVVVLIIAASVGRITGTAGTSSSSLLHGFGGYGGFGLSRHFGGGPFGGGFGAFGGAMRGGVGRFGGFGAGMHHSSGGFGGGIRHTGGSGHFGGGGGGHFSGHGGGGKW